MEYFDTKDDTMEFAAYEKENTDVSSEPVSEFDNTKNEIHEKCGEIFIYENDLFNFLCILCNASPFQSVEKFFSHVLCNHKDRSKCNSDKEEDKPSNPDNYKNVETVKNEPSIQYPATDDANVDVLSHEKSFKTEAKITIEQDQKINSNEVENNSSGESSSSDDLVVKRKKKKKCIKCNVCEKTFTTLKSLKKHNSTVKCSGKTKKVGEKPIKINKIGEKSILQPNKDESYKSVQDESTEQLSDHKISLDNERYDPTHESDLICHKCGKKFVTEKSLKKHIKIAKCIVKFECDMCGKKFGNQKALRRHRLFTRRGHNTEGKLETQIAEINDPTKCCRYCNRFFPDRSHLTIHERVHTGEKPFQCQICGKQFRTKAICTTHERIHSSERQFKCDICNMAFKNRSTLYSHNLRHGEKKFQCNICDKSFFNKQEKEEHETVHTGEKRYQCQICGKQFRTSGFCTRHTRKHLGIRPCKCPYCDKSFYSKQYLKDHIVIHTGERNFICQICNATFPRRKALLSHKKIHSDFRGYVCQICGSAFKQYSGLYLHRRSHNKTTDNIRSTLCME